MRTTFKPLLHQAFKKGLFVSIIISLLKRKTLPNTMSHVLKSWSIAWHYWEVAETLRSRILWDTSSLRSLSLNGTVEPQPLSLLFSFGIKIVVSSSLFCHTFSTMMCCLTQKQQDLLIMD